MENEKKEYDIHLLGEWYVTVMKVELTEEQAAVFASLQDRSKDASTHLEITAHDEQYPPAAWSAHKRL
jgi:hypothetical protein